MSEQIKNGGPAFPVFGVNCVRQDEYPILAAELKELAEAVKQ